MYDTFTFLSTIATSGKIVKYGECKFLASLRCSVWCEREDFSREGGKIHVLVVQKY